MSNIIGAKVLKGAKLPSRTLLGSLVVTGGVEVIKKHLERYGWEKREPVCVPVFTIDEGDAAVKLSRWVLMGGLDKPVRFKADQVFNRAEANIIVTVKLPHLSIFEFRDKNSSYWVDSEELEVTMLDKNKREEPDEQAARDKGVGPFCARAFLVPESPATALLLVALVPFTKAEMKEKLPCDYNSTNCPQVPVSLGLHGARAKRIKMMVREKEKDGFGFGCFPLLEALFPGQPTLPDPKDLKEALYAFMRQVEGHNNRGGSTIARALESAVEVAKVDPLLHRWPALERDNTDDEEGDEGKRSLIILPNTDQRL